MTDDLIRRDDAIDALTELSCDDNAHWGAIIDAIRAMPAAPMMAPAVRVKPLVWEEQPGKSYRQANSPFGQYQISFLVEFECWQLCRPHKAGEDWGSRFSRHSHKDEAKAAAQADYETRTRSGLVDAPADPLGADWMRREAEKLVLDWVAATRHPLLLSVQSIPGPTPAQLLVHALRLPEVARLWHALLTWDAAHRTGQNEPLNVAFELGQAALAALEGGEG